MQASGDLASDIVEIKDGPVGYLEASVTRSKNACSLERKTRYLAMCAKHPRVDAGLLGHQVARDRRRTRSQVASPVEAGGWQDSPVSVKVGARCAEPFAQVRPGSIQSMWSRRHFRLAFHGRPNEGWTATRYNGVPSLPSLPSFFRSKLDVVCGRHNVAPVLKVLDTIVEAVAVGRFLSDYTRSGMFPNNVSKQSSSNLRTRSLSSGRSEDEEDKDPAEEERAADDVTGPWEPIRETFAKLIGRREGWALRQRS